MVKFLKEFPKKEPSLLLAILQSHMRKQSIAMEVD